MKPSIICLFIATSFLTGCVSDYAANQCKSAGLEPGTSEYNNCFNQVADHQRQCWLIAAQAQMSGGNAAQQLASMDQAGCQ